MKCEYENCTFEARINFAMNQHKLNVHGEPWKALTRSYQCSNNECDFMAETKEAIAEHAAIAHGKLHESRPHSESPRSTAGSSSEHFAGVDPVVLANIKREATEHECVFCKRSFESGSDLMRHKQSEHWAKRHEFGRKLHRCKTCYFSTNQRRQLLRHQKSVHWISPEKRFQCRLCPSWSTNHESGLYKHKRKKHPDEDKSNWLVEATQPNTNTVDEGSLVECEYCEFVTSSTERLQKHVTNQHKRTSKKNAPKMRPKFEINRHSGKIRKKRSNCKNCSACLRDNCGQCIFCKDMPKFGGRGKARQRCIMRKCETPIKTLTNKLSNTVSISNLVRNDGDSINIPGGKENKRQCFKCPYKKCLYVGKKLPHLKIHICYKHERNQADEEDVEMKKSEDGDLVEEQEPIIIPKRHLVRRDSNCNNVCEEKEQEDQSFTCPYEKCRYVGKKLPHLNSHICYKHKRNQVADEDVEMSESEDRDLARRDSNCNNVCEEKEREEQSFKCPYEKCRYVGKKLAHLKIHMDYKHKRNEVTVEDVAMRESEDRDLKEDRKQIEEETLYISHHDDANSEEMEHSSIAAEKDDENLLDAVKENDGTHEKNQVTNSAKSSVEESVPNIPDDPKDEMKHEEDNHRWEKIFIYESALRKSAMKSDVAESLQQKIMVKVFTAASKGFFSSDRLRFKSTRYLENGSVELLCKDPYPWKELISAIRIDGRRFRGWAENEEEVFRIKILAGSPFDNIPRDQLRGFIDDANSPLKINWLTNMDDPQLLTAEVNKTVMEEIYFHDMTISCKLTRLQVEEI